MRGLKGHKGEKVRGLGLICRETVSVSHANEDLNEILFN